MSFAALASNQTVSYTNLQDAITNGIFTITNSITSSGRGSTKSFIMGHVTGYNPNYPPFAAKSSNQLVVKGDIYNTGTVTLSPQYGMYFTGISGTNIGSFTYPVNHIMVSNYINQIPSQTITIYLDGTMVTSPLNISIYIDNIYLSCQAITSSGPQSKSFVLPNYINAPSALYITIDSGTCPSVPPPATFTGTSVSYVAVSKTTGQYQVVAKGSTSNYYPTTQGYLYVSSNYGSSWTTITNAYGYFYDIAISNNGAYVLAVAYNGYAYLSSNYGASFGTISSLGTNTFIGCAVSGTGQYQTIVGQYSTGGAYYLKRSTDYGATWSNPTSIATSGYSQNLSCVTMDSTGQYQAIGSLADTINSGVKPAIYLSSDYGATWTVSFTNSFSGISIRINRIKYSPNAGKLYAVGYDGAYAYNINLISGTWTINNNFPGTAMYLNDFMPPAVNDTTISYFVWRVNDGGTNTRSIQQMTNLSPANLSSAGLKSWQGIDISNNGTYILAGASSGLFLSTNSGSTFTAIT